MVVLLLAAAMLQAPPGQLRLDCETTERRTLLDRRAVANTAPSPLTITLDVQGRRIASVVMDGPPLFSSYRRRDAGAGAARQLLPRNAQWRGHFHGNAIRLRRGGTDMVLEPRVGTALSHVGFWTSVATVEHIRMETNDVVRCRTVSGSLSESARR
jgi:hypothetical protein